MTAGLWVFAVVAVGGALVLSYFLGSEVFGLVRDFTQTAREKEPVADAPRLRGRRLEAHGTGPLNPDRVIGPFQDRETVERLITYFEQDESEEESSSSAASR